MSDGEQEKWNREGRGKDLPMSPSCSSFEVLDPHDPVISRLATQLFKVTHEYLHGEMAAGQDHYNLLEEMNRQAITKYADLRSLAVNLNRTFSDYNEMCRRARDEAAARANRRNRSASDKVRGQRVSSGRVHETTESTVQRTRREMKRRLKKTDEHVPSGLFIFNTLKGYKWSKI